MSVFGRLDGHEEVVFFNEPASGLRAIVAIYSTALGPALGGTRFMPYESEAHALDDVLKLSRAMAYKAACAGLDLGGGKAVIIGEPSRDKTEALLRAYGRCLQTLGGRYYTACDVGTYPEDMDVIAQECTFVTGRWAEAGGAGDSAVLTAFGVFQAMSAAAEHAWGEPTLRGRRVGVAGVGKVGSRLTEYLVDDGATVVVADVTPAAVERVRSTHPDVAALTPDELTTTPLDVYAPCALGDALSYEVIERLDARIVCGGANNQLAADGVDGALAERGVLYVPDFVANAGGVIQVGSEACGYSADAAEAKAAAIFDTTLSILEEATAQGLLPNDVAERRAEKRMAQNAAGGDFA